MYIELAWVPLSSRTLVLPQIILYPDHLPDFLPAFYDYDTFRQGKDSCQEKTFHTFLQEKDTLYSTISLIRTSKGWREGGSEGARGIKFRFREIFELFKVEFFLTFWSNNERKRNIETNSNS